MNKEKNSATMYAKEDTKAPPRKSHSLRNLLIALIAIVIVLALALGLGLGLGLKHRKSAQQSPSTATTEDSLASSAIQPWRQSTKDYSLNFTNWDINAPPTTRVYNFTISQAQIAPDGRFDNCM
jgi:flagellar basal body-associated protein FliL